MWGEMAEGIPIPVKLLSEIKLGFCMYVIYFAEKA